VNQVVPASDVMGEALRLAEEICANSPLGVRATKALMVETARGDAAGGWAHVDQEKGLVFSSNDAHEGATAFVERRQPVWTAT
jgi:enoyl-CoA hydratase